MKYTYILLVLLLSVPSLLHADPPDNPWDRDKVLEPGSSMILIGPFGGIDFNMHKGVFSISDGRLICCTFDGGNGVGAVFGGKAMIPLAEGFNLSPRLLYENRAGTFNATPQVYPILGKGNTTEPITLQNKLGVSLHSLSIDVLGTYELTKFGLYVAAGPSATVELSNRYVQTETISSPSGVKYLNGSTSQTVLDGSLDLTKKFTASLRGGLGVNIPLTPSVSLNPEVLYTLPLGNISKETNNNNWSVSTVQATVGILFTL